VPWRGRSHRAVDILVVCTGNVCRSPYIAEMLRASLPDLSVASAGSSALVGDLPGELVVKALADRGVDGSGLVPGRVLTGRMVRNARLIITATRAHRLFVTDLHPRAANRTFTLKELAHLLDPPPRENGIDGVVSQAALRATTFDELARDEDLSDPYGLLWPAYQRMADEVDAALGVIVPALSARIAH
jgi:protein-tyrosine phosphatase